MFSQQILALQQALAKQPGALSKLLLLLLKAKQSHPPSNWLREWGKLRTVLPDHAMCNLLLILAGIYTPEANRQEFFATLAGGEAKERSQASCNLARGAIWALSDFPKDKVYDFLTQTILAWSGSGEGNPACGNAAIWALDRLASEAALYHLNALRSRVTHRALQKKIQDALAGLADKSGLSIEELSDQLVPDHGLNVQAERNWMIGDFSVNLRIAPDGRLEQVILDSKGKPRQSLPKQVRETYAGQWQTVLSEKRALGKTLNNQKNHLEAAMVDGRRWSLSTWGETFPAHPILGHLARRLVWEVFSADNTTITYALPRADQTWQDAWGETVQVPVDGSLEIAHPVKMTPEQQSAWQRSIVTQRLVQPFKQVFRETYVLTPPEIETYDYSNRFAAHRILSRHLYALTRNQGWRGTLGLTGFDGSGTGSREFPAYNVRACLWHQFASHENELVTLEQVSFQALRLSSRQGQECQRIPLQTVHPVAFSETMRDIDLAVAIASVGTDKHWQDWEVARRRGEVSWEQQQIDYEKIAAATAKTRAVLLQELIPVLGLSTQVRVEGRFVLVKGRLNQYRIHLGSGNIHIEPSGRYVCIVAQSNTQHLYLPFEENDPRTAEIISKILLLVHDDQITDPSILTQINIP